MDNDAKEVRILHIVFGRTSGGTSYIDVCMDTYVDLTSHTEGWVDVFVTVLIPYKQRTDLLFFMVHNNASDHIV